MIAWPASNSRTAMAPRSPGPRLTGPAREPAHAGSGPAGGFAGGLAASTAIHCALLAALFAAWSGVAPVPETGIVAQVVIVAEPSPERSQTPRTLSVAGATASEPAPDTTAAVPPRPSPAGASGRRHPDRPAAQSRASDPTPTDIAVPETAPPRVPVPKPRQRPDSTARPARVLAPPPAQPAAMPAETVAGEAGPPAPATAQAAVGALRAASAPRPAADPRAAIDDYRRRILAWLERHKDYPLSARIAGLEGEAVIRFTLDREGRVVAHSLERGSGVAALDRAARAMMMRADPFPPPPAALPGERLDYVVPIRFGLD